MSVASLTTIAAARAEARKPKRGEVGKVPKDHAQASADAKITDILAKQIPTELIAPYTAFTAAIVGAVAKPTPRNPHPDQLNGWRWLAYLILIGSVIVMVTVGTSVKVKRLSFPWVSVFAGVLVATMWAFLAPGSPLAPYFHSHNAKTFVPLAFALVAVPVATLSAALLKFAPPTVGSRRRRNAR